MEVNAEASVSWRALAFKQTTKLNFIVAINSYHYLLLFSPNHDTSTCNVTITVFACSR